MIIKLIPLFLLCFACHGSFSQVVIAGKITDPHENPVPFAHLVLETMAIGTTTNMEGQFMLTISEQYSQLKIEISAIGYVSKTISIEKSVENLNIILHESVVELEAVVVKPIDYGRKLVLAAIDNIPNNFPNDSEILTVFGRSIVSMDINQKVPFYIIETLTEAFKNPYQNSDNSNHVKIIQSRKFEFRAIDSLRIRFYNGAHIIHWGDLVNERSGPLNSKRIDQFNFNITDTLTIDNSIVFKIEFDSKNNGRGLIFIVKENYAIAKMELHYEERELVNIKEEIGSQINGYHRINKDYIAEYHLFNDSSWRIFSINYSSSFTDREVVNLHIKNEAVITNFDKSKENIPYPERLNFKDILIEKVGDYDSGFWNYENTILPDAELKLLLKTNPLRDTNAVSKSERVVNFLSKFQAKSGGMFVPQYINQGSVDYQSLVNIQGTYSEGSSPNFAFKSNISYEIRPHFYIGIETWSSIKKNLFTGNFLTTHYDYQLFPNSRPFYLTPGLKTGYINSRQKLTTIQPETTFKLDGKKFDANQVDVYVENRGFCLTPSLSLSIEKNSRMRFYLEGGYNFMLKEKEGLFLIEDQIFFKRKKAFIPSDDENLIMDFGSRSSIRNDFFVGFGVIMQF